MRASSWRQPADTIKNTNLNMQLHRCCHKQQLSHHCRTPLTVSPLDCLPRAPAAAPSPAASCCSVQLQITPPLPPPPPPPTTTTTVPASTHQQRHHQAITAARGNNSNNQPDPEWRENSHHGSSCHPQCCCCPRAFHKVLHHLELLHHRPSNCCIASLTHGLGKLLFCELIFLRSLLRRVV